MVHSCWCGCGRRWRVRGVAGKREDGGLLVQTTATTKIGFDSLFSSIRLSPNARNRRAQPSDPHPVLLLRLIITPPLLPAPMRHATTRCLASPAPPRAAAAPPPRPHPAAAARAAHHRTLGHSRITASADAARASRSAPPSSPTTTLAIKRRVPYGSTVRVVGAWHGWNVEASTAAAWSEDDVWRANVDAPPGSEFKFIVVDGGRGGVGERAESGGGERCRRGGVGEGGCDRGGGGRRGAGC